MFQSFQNCPKLENLNYEVLQCLTERYFRDNPYISVICHSKFQLQPIFPYSGVTDTGEGAMGKRPPPNPSSWKSQRKTFQGKLQQTKFLYSPVSLRYPNISRKFSPLITDSSGLCAHLLQNFLSYYQFLSEHIFSSFVPLVANHSFSRV